MKTANAIGLLSIFLFTSWSRADVTAELRFDFEDHTFNDTYTANYSTFRVNRARLKIDSAIDDYFSYYIRLNLNSSVVVDPTATSNITNKSIADNTTDLLEFAYLNYKIGPELLLTMGKMGTLTGGMEGLHNGGDVYVYSQSSPAWGQYTGVGLTYFYNEDHSLIAHLANQEVPYKDLTKGSSYAQKRLAWAVQYYGMFFDKTFHVITSYLNSKPHNSVLEQQDDSFLAVGLKYQQPSFYIEADHLLNTFKNKTTAGTADSSAGIVATAAIKSNQFQTGLKYAADSTKISDVKSADYNTVGLFTEYRPFDGKEMNVHAAFNSITTRPAIGENKTEQQLLVGIKYYFSAIKP